MARTPEQRAWDSFSSSIDTSILMCKRIENMAGDGTPDVSGINRNGVGFWLENKALTTWAKRDTTFPLRDKFEKGQIPWMRSWNQWHGKAFVLLRVELEYYLLNPNGPKDLREMTQTEIRNEAMFIGKPAILEYLEKMT